MCVSTGYLFFFYSGCGRPKRLVLNLFFLKPYSIRLVPFFNNVLYFEERTSSSWLVKRSIFIRNLLDGRVW